MDSSYTCLHQTTAAQSRWWTVASPSSTTPPTTSARPPTSAYAMGWFEVDAFLTAPKLHIQRPINPLSISIHLQNTRTPHRRLTEEGVEVLLGVDVLDATESTVTLRDKSQVSADVVAQQAAAGAPEAIGGVAVGTGAGEGAAGAAGAEAGNIVLPADLIVWTAGACVCMLMLMWGCFH